LKIILTEQQLQILTEVVYGNYWSVHAQEAGEKYKFVKGKLYIKFTTNSNLKATDKDYEFIRAQFFRKKSH